MANGIILTGHPALIVFQLRQYRKKFCKERSAESWGTSYYLCSSPVQRGGRPLQACLQIFARPLPDQLSPATYLYTLLKFQFRFMLQLQFQFQFQFQFHMPLETLDRESLCLNSSYILSSTVNPNRFIFLQQPCFLSSFSGFPVCKVLMSTW